MVSSVKCKEFSRVATQEEKLKVYQGNLSKLGFISIAQGSRNRRGIESTCQSVSFIHAALELTKLFELSK